MQSSLEKLRKFFRLEAENKYANTAVIGGLAKILDFWKDSLPNRENRLPFGTRIRALKMGGGSLAL